MTSLKYTVEFNGSKGWEIGYERSDANDTMPYETKGHAEAYMDACLSDGINIRLWIEIDEPYRDDPTEFANEIGTAGMSLVAQMFQTSEIQRKMGR